MKTKSGDIDDWSKDLSEEDKIAVFEEIFLKEVESWFSHPVTVRRHSKDVA